MFYFQIDLNNDKIKRDILIKRRGSPVLEDKSIANDKKFKRLKSILSKIFWEMILVLKSSKTLSLKDFF